MKAFVVETEDVVYSLHYTIYTETYCYSSGLHAVLCFNDQLYSHFTQQLHAGKKMVNNVLENLDKLIRQLHNMNGKL